MWRTRVGYAGGTTTAPTYRSIGDHSEAIQIDFDPTVISYADLLAVFTQTHNPRGRTFSRQYRSAVFVHDDAQRTAATAALAAHAEEHGAVNTKVEAFTGFTNAEDYHQKYRLRGTAALMQELADRFADPAAFRESTVAARLNGWLAGAVDRATFEADLARCGLSADAAVQVRARVR